MKSVLFRLNRKVQKQQAVVQRGLFMSWNISGPVSSYQMGPVTPVCHLQLMKFHGIMKRNEVIFCRFVQNFLLTLY